MNKNNFSLSSPRETSVKNVINLMRATLPKADLVDEYVFAQVYELYSTESIKSLNKEYTITIRGDGGYGDTSMNYRVATVLSKLNKRIIEINVTCNIFCVNETDELYKYTKFTPTMYNNVSALNIVIMDNVLPTFFFDEHKKVKCFKNLTCLHIKLESGVKPKTLENLKAFLELNETITDLMIGKELFFCDIPKRIDMVKIYNNFIYEDYNSDFRCLLSGIYTFSKNNSSKCFLSMLESNIFETIMTTKERIKFRTLMKYLKKEEN